MTDLFLKGGFSIECRRVLHREKTCVRAEDLGGGGGLVVRGRLGRRGVKTSLSPPQKKERGGAQYCHLGVKKSCRSFRGKEEERKLASADLRAKKGTRFTMDLGKSRHYSLGIRGRGKKKGGGLVR